MSETLVIHDLAFEVRRSQRRATLGLTVDRFGELVIHAPAVAQIEELRNWVEKKLLWVHQKLLLKDSVGTKSKPLEVVSGETISYLGRNYRLKLVEKQAQPLMFDGDWFILRRRDQAAVAQHFQKWYEQAGAEWLAKRVIGWQRKTGKAPASIAVSALGFRWASCGRDRILRFNWQLFQLPVRLIDYVIVHELMHLKEHNHTPEFWRVLEAVMPDWQTRKSELAGLAANVNWR
jgi:predicted metal-dependent hydrolase